jgi:hypothetical protein
MVGGGTSAGTMKKTIGKAKEIEKRGSSPTEK